MIAEGDIMEQGMERTEEDKGKNKDEVRINKAPDSDPARVTFGEEEPVEETKEPSESLLQWVVSSETRYRKLSIVTHLLIILLLTVIVTSQSFVDVDFEFSKVNADLEGHNGENTYVPNFKFLNKGLKRARDVRANVEIYFTGTEPKYQGVDVGVTSGRDVGSNDEMGIKVRGCTCYKGYTYKFIITLFWEGESETFVGAFTKDR